MRMNALDAADGQRKYDDADVDAALADVGPFFGFDGEPIDGREWLRLRHEPGKVVAVTDTACGVSVRSAWLGRDQRDVPVAGESPLIYGTVTCWDTSDGVGGWGPETCSSSREAAQEFHVATIAALDAGWRPLNYGTAG